MENFDKVALITSRTQEIIGIDAIKNTFWY